MLPKQALGQLPTCRQPQPGIAGLFQNGVNPGDPSPHFFILDSFPCLPVVLHDLPSPAATLRVYLVENHVPAFGYAYMVLFYDVDGVFPANHAGQKQGKIAVYFRIYRAFYDVCRYGP